MAKGSPSLTWRSWPGCAAAGYAARSAQPPARRADAGWGHAADTPVLVAAVMDGYAWAPDEGSVGAHGAHRRLATLMATPQGQITA